MTQYGERRRAQRVDARLRLQLYLDGAEGERGGAAELETINISTSGVYFRSGHHIAPMTKLAMGLELAIPGSDRPDADLALVQCEGIVVRTEPEQDQGDGEYEIAVFFTWFESEGQAILADHINLLIAGT